MEHYTVNRMWAAILRTLTARVCIDLVRHIHPTNLVSLVCANCHLGQNSEMPKSLYGGTAFGAREVCEER